jgi:hypothetical protein
MKRFLVAAVLVVAGLAPAVSAQEASGAPLKKFSLPVFNEFGHRIWILRAELFHILSDKADRFELTAVHLQVFAGDAANTLDVELFAPQAVVDKPKQIVSGQGQLHVIGRGVELFGRDWICHAETKSIVVEHDVVITFSGDLGNILQ